MKPNDSASLAMHIVVESIKYQTSRIGSITTIWLIHMNMNKKRKRSSVRLFFSIGIEGSLPIGQPEYHYFERALLNFLNSGCKES